MSVRPAGGAVMARRRSSGERDRVQTPRGTKAHPPGGSVLGFHTTRVYDVPVIGPAHSVAPPPSLQLRAQAQTHQLQTLHHRGPGRP